MIGADYLRRSWFGGLLSIDLNTNHEYDIVHRITHASQNVLGLDIDGVYQLKTTMYPLQIYPPSPVQLPSAPNI